MARRDPVTAEAVILSMDLTQRCDGKGWHWDVSLTRPGRDGTFTKTWENRSGRLTASQAEDLSAWVQTSAMHALVAWGGVQQEADMR